MSAVLMLLAAMAAAGGEQPSPRPQATKAAALDSADRARDRATNESLLAALRQRRSEMARSPLGVNDEHHAEARRYALEFIDRQMEKVRKEMER